MKRYAWLIAPALIVLYCCNSEKKVLRDPVKTQNVVNAWMKTANFKTDTLVKFLPGDTTTTLLIAYDTTTVHDTVTNMREKVITKTKTITNTVHDTVRVTIVNNDLVNKYQAQLQASVAERDKLKDDIDKWRGLFWGVAILAGLYISFRVFAFFKVITFS